MIKSKKRKPGLPDKIALSPETMSALGQLYVDEIVKEAKKYFAKRGRTGESQSGSSLFDSFSYKVKGDEVTVYSSWSGLDEEGIIFLPGEGVVVARDKPLTSEEWIHPRMSDFNFVNIGVKKARKKGKGLISREIIKILRGHNIFA